MKKGSPQHKRIKHAKQIILDADVFSVELLKKASEAWFLEQGIIKKAKYRKLTKRQQYILKFKR